MLKTLKITGIIAAALAVLFLVFSAVFGARGNDDIENFLDSPGAVENFKKAHGNKQKKGQNQTSPLVKQAQKFASILNPPVKPRKTTSVRKTGIPVTPARPKTVSAKFKLIGTSFYPTNPEMSLALIDEPGKGFRWVRQSGKVGHLIIQQIKDGLVVVKDDQRTFEMTPQRKPKKSLIRNPLLPSSTPTDLPPEGLRNLPMLPQGRRTKPPTDDTMTRMERFMRKRREKQSDTEFGVGILKGGLPKLGSEENIAAFRKRFNERKRRPRQGGFEKMGSEQESEEIAAWMQETVEEFKATHISAEEAARLEDLAQELEELRPVQEQVDSNSDSTEKNDPKPNNPD